MVVDNPSKLELIKKKKEDKYYDKFLN